MLLKLVWRNLVRRPWQTSLTIFVVAACTAALVASLLTLWSIENGAKSALNQWGADVLVLPAQAEYSPEEVLFTGSPANIYMDAQVLKEISGIDGVEKATPQFFSQTLNQSCCSLPDEYRLVGYDPVSDFLVNGLLAQGVGRELNQDEVIIGGEIPAFLGDRVVILGQPFDVAGYLNPKGGSIDRTIFVPIDTARRVASQSPYLQEIWQRAGNPQGLVSAVLLKTSEGVSPEIVGQRISKISGVKAVTAGKLMQSLQEQLIAFRSVIWVLVLIICAITAASLYTRYSSLILEKREEVGLLRILGARKNQVFGMILAESLITVLTASALGSLLGLGLLIYFKLMLKEYSSFPFLIPNLSQMLIALGGLSLVTLWISLLAALWPARRSARLDPVLALSEGQLR
ncbi:ABC transporter permease [Desulfosporosinus meridiei]|uniref:ABC-type transport system, involved in lipoprotein release, permease component n=1 Tax=Desulfosporosinus meridiei (strain ATCC BAA-275 / DSM 13257 / KCTC 12902 / NCIMB 13706 / S10) TaxID=768704 RepID=J7IUD6_DESMD|nr:FtsX-like permease family protein [Desulfosporosinus meridiei]AFQ45315.1 ABC-type transport system, involved in lipoprotein release, permease component [Desulfosporosinus meridiei DSM 13257]